MTNRIALVLGALIMCALILDLLLNSGSATVFLGREFFDLIEWLAFWR